MKIRYGISISSVETVNDLPGLPAFEIVEVPGELSCGEKFSLPSTARGKRLWIRNSEDIRFFRSLPDAGIGVRQEFFQLFLQRCSTAQKLRAESSSIAPDLENAFDDHGYAVKLREALGACFGIAERFRLPLMLETRIPGAAATAPDEFLRFKHSLF